MSDTSWRASASPVGDEGRVPGARWILSSSLWLVPVLFFGGNGAWLGFLIIGCLLLRPSWLVAAGLYAIWALVAGAVPDDQARLAVSGVLQFVSIVHAMIANRVFLVTIWGRLERGEQWWGRGSRRPAPARPRRRPARRRATARAGDTPDVPREAVELLAGEGTGRSDYVADPVEDVADAVEAPATQAAVAAPPTVDVNSATVDEFRTLPGFTKKRAEAAVAARDARSRFASVQEFADDLNLQPHELVRLRDRVTCSRPRRRSFGRRVDL